MIFDVFTFFNELDVLEIRLNELSPMVDVFVLVEATMTFSGLPKPLHFEQHKARFSRFMPRIRHVIVGNMPPGPDPWIRENYQRDCAMQALGDLMLEDVVIFGDVDEIPIRTRVENQLVKERLTDAIRLGMEYYAFHLNLLTRNPWNSAIVTSGREFLARPPSRMRFFQAPTLPLAGWHFSYMGGVQAVVDKLQSFSCHDYGSVPYQIAAYTGGVLPRDYDAYLLFKVPVDKEMPAFVRENRVLLERRGLLLP